MHKETITFGDTKVEKQIFHQPKNGILIYDVNIDRVVVPRNFSFGKKVLNTLLDTKMITKKLCPYL